MKGHWAFNINWIGFPSTHRKVKGCYMIGNTYIGASIHIRSRILQHCNLVKRDLDLGKIPLGLTSRKYDYIKECILKKEPIEVRFLSNNPMDEQLMHELWSMDYNPNAVMYHVMYKNENI